MHTTAARTLPLLAALAAALLLRALLWGNLPREGLISDEGEYLSAATWLAQGRGFDWYQGYLWTRAPLYPLFVAAHLRLFGASLDPIFLTQTLLSLANVALTFWLARRLTAPGSLAAPLAALLAALYLPLATYAQVLLSETLYITLVLGALLLLAATAPRWPALAAAGALLGLATLTRSLTLALLPLVGLWLLLRAPPRRSWRAAALLLAAAAAVIAPWSLYASRTFGGPVLVDTSGAFNLLVGAWTAHDGERRDAPTRDFVQALFPGRAAPPDETCLPHPGPLPSQAARQAAMSREGLCLIADRPLAFAQKTLAELVDLFQINYTGAERFTNGFSTGRLPPWYVLALFLLDDTLYVLTLPLALVGWALLRSPDGPAGQRSAGALIGLWLLASVALAPLLFAINRFRLPLLPLAFILAGVALDGLLRRRAALRAALGTRYGVACAALGGLLWLAAATPHAYLEPRRPGDDSRWASYLGPYPSSLAITRRALEARPAFLGDERFLAALRAGDADAAEQVLRAGPVGRETARLGPALVAGLRREHAAGLELLPSPATIVAARDWRASVARGDLLRSLGDAAGARAALTPSFVDAANPVAWAYERLHPAPTGAIDLGGNLDLGYIVGCYLGEGSPAERTTYRWCTDGARLRFPGAGSGAPQRLTLAADGRGWPADMPAGPVRVLLDGVEVGAFTPERAGPRSYSVVLPALPAGADVVVELRGPTFVPDAARFLSQQGEDVVGQVQRLAVRLDRAELQP